MFWWILGMLLQIKKKKKKNLIQKTMYQTVWMKDPIPVWR